MMRENPAAPPRVLALMRFLARLASVLFRPRRTMRRILDDGPGQGAVLLLFVLVVISGIAGDFDAAQLQDVLARLGGQQVWLIVGVTVAVFVAMVAVGWFYAWVPYFIGRFLGGTGDIRAVRAAVAWGLAPGIWALLYRVPVAVWLTPAAAATVKMRGGGVAFDPGFLARGCGVALAIVLLELIVFVWCAFVMSNTLAEAHGYSPWQALGTIVLSAIAPMVVMIAAVLAIA